MPTLADAAAAGVRRHTLYEEVVQGDGEATVAVFYEAYRLLFGREPEVLREDFCGTALLLKYWLAEDPDGFRAGEGIDFDPECIEIAKNSACAAWARDLADSRMKLTLGDVQGYATDDADFVPDVVVALNHSYNVFHERCVLLDYFRGVYASLGAAGGLFMLDAYGGRTAHTVGEHVRPERNVGGGVVEYRRCVEAFDPGSRRCRWHIDFVFSDGSRLAAFDYDWTVWRVPDLIAMLEEAGFSSSPRVYYTPCTAIAIEEKRRAPGRGATRPHLDDMRRWQWFVAAGGMKVEFEICDVNTAGDLVLVPVDLFAELPLCESDQMEAWRTERGGDKFDEVSMSLELTATSAAATTLQWSGTVPLRQCGNGRWESIEGAPQAPPVTVVGVGDLLPSVTEVCVRLSEGDSAALLQASDGLQQSPIPSALTPDVRGGSVYQPRDGIDLDALADWYAYIVASKPPVRP